MAAPLPLSLPPTCAAAGAAPAGPSDPQPLGYDLPQVSAWLAQAVPQLQPPLHWQRLEGGHSNLTYLLTDTSGRRAVIRRPPLGELLPKAHDMGREWALISALGPTPVPVPQALGFCEDTAVTGAHFYVMGHVDGLPLYSAAEAEARVPMALRPTLGESFIDVLADLHAVDPQAVGLGGLGQPTGYIARQLKTWYRSWQASVAPAQLDDPRAHRLQQHFLDHVPPEGPARVVHGDYGLHNTLIGADGRVVAVVDWEISTLGDPLADLAYALNQWAEPGDPPGHRAVPPTSLPGFPSRQALAERYAARTGRDLSGLAYYTAFNRWKSACILHGVYARYRAGQKSTEGVDLDAMRQTIGQTLGLAEAALQRGG